mmetsp:Transcript_67646/g.106531  ORF Transcript_67646/g.106531 Transcript_67646/m.106531 type:complete len:87 (-) Transcript_67646:246-506(-)
MSVNLVRIELKTAILHKRSQTIAVIQKPILDGAIWVSVHSTRLAESKPTTKRNAKDAKLTTIPNELKKKDMKINKPATQISRITNL